MLFICFRFVLRKNSTHSLRDIRDTDHSEFLTYRYWSPNILSSSSLRPKRLAITTHLTTDKLFSNPFWIDPAVNDEIQNFSTIDFPERGTNCQKPINAAGIMKIVPLFQLLNRLKPLILYHHICLSLTVYCSVLCRRCFFHILSVQSPFLYY